MLRHRMLITEVLYTQGHREDGYYEEVVWRLRSAADLAPLPVKPLRPKDLIRLKNADAEVAPRTHAKPPRQPKPAFLRGAKQSRQTAAPRGR
jgi:hypothetical protein